MDWLTRSASLFPPASTESTSGGIWHTYSGNKGSDTLWVWLHGWGQTHRSFIPLLEQCEDQGDHLLVDFPGFGNSPLPTSTWTTLDYAEHLHTLIEHFSPPYQKIIFVGHSFGCRVSLRYARRYPNTVSGMIFIGGAGLKRQLSLPQQLRRTAIKNLLKLGKCVDKYVPTHCADWVRNRFGSSDYRQAGPLRSILNNVVSEDLAPLAEGLTLPALLIYGELDTQTPPEFGERYHRLMPESALHILSGFDHYTILTHAKYQVARLMLEWKTRLPLSTTLP